ncbi:hypothetical protein MKW94_011169 [Papaver nudicaule]|uniref:Small ribosomal subunit protein uS15c n=1 Tax=Papaver nudicaule TaxID=74823 RepID=A0AA41VN66_PAPNU|nr:hypothetical protein [Papaver nudicaule]
MALQLRLRFRPIQNPDLIKLFSTSSSPASSIIGDVKQSLSNDDSSPASAKLDEIKTKLSEFRLRSSAPPPTTTSFQELYKRNVSEKTDDKKEANVSISSIRDSLRNLNARPNNNNNNYYYRGIDLKSSVKRGTEEEINKSTNGGGSELPRDIFGIKEMKEKSQAEIEATKTEFLNPYSHEDLGRKLRLLRPDDETTKKEFTLHELNERLKKLRVMDEQVVDKVGGLPLKSLKESLIKLKLDSDDKTKMQMHNISVFGGYRNQYTGPAKELLVEKYFHPDNMSSGEKMKLELKKVRDEYKISESDCGSSRVQVAQLTTKIKHLSSVLHKKDKHSRKGLVAMVQRRKKILRYLRRTDWDSYCQVLSQLGLRDNPDYKH